METTDHIKEMVRQKYSEIALQDRDTNAASCCGAGNDAFIARHETGETGKVISIDFTPAMVERARRNAESRSFHNVEFRQGNIEAIPVTANTADVIASNCVLNLVPNKDGVLKDIYRVLKPGGHFSISDIVLEGDLPASIKEATELATFRNSGTDLRSIPVYAEKPVAEKASCC